MGEFLSAKIDRVARENGLRTEWWGKGGDGLSLRSEIAPVTFHIHQPFTPIYWDIVVNAHYDNGNVETLFEFTPDTDVDKIVMHLRVISTGK